MGELTRKIGTIHVGDKEYDVELNRCTKKNGLYDVHIQNPSFRLNISEQDLCKMAAAIIYADEKISIYKGVKNGKT